MYTELLKDMLKEDVYHRGADSPEFGKGSFKGAWVSKDKDTAAQYGRLHSYNTQKDMNLLSTDSAEARGIEQEFIDRYPEQEEMVNQDGEFTELWMFPPEELIDMLSAKGYDGYNNGTDTFVINPEETLK